MQDKPDRQAKEDALYGTLDVIILKSLDTMGPLHGHGIAKRLEQASDGSLQLNPGTIYASLLRLLQRRWISAAWGTSDHNRRAKFYTITKAGRRRLQDESARWSRVAGLLARLLDIPGRS